MKGYIYMLTSPLGKKYIGRTIDFKRRMRQYTYDSKKDVSPIYREINKHGFENFDKEILIEIDVERNEIDDKLNQLEKECIEKYNTVDKGLNQYSFSNTTYKKSLSEEVKEKMRVSQTGRKHTKESKNKRSGANAYQRKKVQSNTLQMTFDTLKQAAEFVGIANGCKISECIKGIRKSAGKNPKTNIPIRDWKYV